MISGKPAVISPGSLLLPFLLGGNALGTVGSDIILKSTTDPQINRKSSQTQCVINDFLANWLQWVAS